MALESSSTSSSPGPAGSDIPAIIEPLCAVFRRALKAEGLKYTPERAQILDSVMRFEGVFEADRVLRDVRETGFRVSKATVYRTIKLLQDAGIIQRVPFDQDQAVFQVAYGGLSKDLLVRLDTHQVLSIHVPELEAIRNRLCEQLGLQANSHRFVIFATGS